MTVNKFIDALATMNEHRAGADANDAARLHELERRLPDQGFQRVLGHAHRPRLARPDHGSAERRADWGSGQRRTVPLEADLVDAIAPARGSLRTR